VFESREGHTGGNPVCPSAVRPSDHQTVHPSGQPLSVMNVLTRNNVRISGRGTQPMLFAHGFGCDQNMWRFVAPAFEEDYKVILFDYVGSGRSDVGTYDAKRYGSLAGYTQDVLDIVHELDLTDVIFVGHSVSSMVGVLAANAEPERFAKLVMIGPSPRYINDGDSSYVGGFERADIEGLLDTMDHNFVGWADFMAPVIMKNPERPELTSELASSFCSTDPKIARNFAEATFFADNRDDLAKVRVPSLVLQVSDDAIAPVSVGEFVRDAIPGSAFRLLDATGHCPHMSHPAETIEAMKEYLSAVHAG
jgi:sigma-B regulation protein RsbQ